MAAVLAHLAAVAQGGDLALVVLPVLVVLLPALVVHLLVLAVLLPALVVLLLVLAVLAQQQSVMAALRAAVLVAAHLPPSRQSCSAAWARTTR